MEVKVHTKLCNWCQKDGLVTIEATDEQLDEMNSPNRRHIQFIFPELSAEIREQMISGTHPNCWDEMIESSEDDLS